jgi:hypothetical protein
MDYDEIRRQQFAIRSFTESIEMDSLPPGLETRPGASSTPYGNGTAVDRHTDYMSEQQEQQEASSGRRPKALSKMTSSSTADTIIELATREGGGESSQYDPKKGETQKYVITVPGPGHHDQEVEMHRSLLRDKGGEEEASPEDELTSKPFRPPPLSCPGQPSASPEPSTASHQDPLRDEWNRAAIERPRPTTPTSWSTLESFVFDEQQKPSTAKSGGSKRVVPVRERLPPDSGARMRVCIPGQHADSGGGLGRSASCPSRGATSTG